MPRGKRRGDRLAVPAPAAARPLVERSPPRPAVDKPLAFKSLAALAAFAGLAFAGVSLAGAAMSAAAGLMLVARTPPKKAFAFVDWQLLVFFAALFVVVAGVAHTGVLTRLFVAVGPAIARGDIADDMAFLGLVVVASNVVSNVPLVLVAVSWVPQMPDPTWGFIMLAVGSTVAGNLTLFGSVANIIVMEGAGPWCAKLCRKLPPMARGDSVVRKECPMNNRSQSILIAGLMITAMLPACVEAPYPEAPDLETVELRHQPDTGLNPEHSMTPLEAADGPMECWNVDSCDGFCGGGPCEVGFCGGVWVGTYCGHFGRCGGSSCGSEMD